MDNHYDTGWDKTFVAKLSKMPRPNHSPGRLGSRVPFHWYRYCNFLIDIAIATGCDSSLNSIDVGCYRGRFTGWMSQRSKKVYAFDPNLRALGFRNDWNNWWTEPVRNKIVYVSAALGAETGTANYHEYRDANNLHRNAAWNSLIDRGHKQRFDFFKNQTLVEDESYSVPVERLDDIIQDSVGFIKIDAEDYDTQVLLGAKNLLEKCQPTVVCEVRSTPGDKTVDLMRSWGYEAYPMGRILQGPVDDNSLCLQNMMFVPSSETEIKNKLISAHNLYVYETQRLLGLGLTADQYHSLNADWISIHLRNLTQAR
jgi:FkbM family methyltransferase